MMLAGSLRHSVIVQSPSVTSTGDRGQGIITWNTVGTVPAMIEDLAGNKLVIARQLVPTSTHRITLRYLAGLVPEGRIIFGSRTFNIGAVNNIKQNDFTMEALVTEVV